MSVQRVAYILLWFPKPSETFIFREVVHLKRMGLPLKVYTLYGELTDKLSPEMKAVSHEVERLGIPYLKRAPYNLAYWRKRDPKTTSWLLRTIPLRRWRSLEVGGENIWAFFAGFTLARLFEADRIERIHAPWANGPATAAWVASKLTGIPFSFTARAVDIYPPDGALNEKIRDAEFVRTNTGVNVSYLKQFTDGADHKIHLIYNGFTLKEFRDAAVPMQPPYRLLALGRFARFKGYDDLLRAAKLLKDSGVDFRLTLGGSGLRELHFRILRQTLGLADRVSFPGFITHDKVSELFCSHDMFVMPSVVHSTGERDGIPNVIVEALLHRLPVVATDVSGIGEVIKDGETGLLAPPGDPHGLSQAILRMTRDRDAALRMAAAGRAKVLDQFDPEKNHRKVLELNETRVSIADRTWLP